jgi:hypothetical protein
MDPRPVTEIDLLLHLFLFLLFHQMHLRFKNNIKNVSSLGHAVAYWLRRYVTKRKVAGSRPDEVNDFYQFT